MEVKRTDAGFTIIEVLAAMGILVVGVMGLLTALALGARRLSGSQDQLIASQRASELVESVFKARDTRTLSWAQIRNVTGGGGGGIFLDGAQNVRDPGPDGLSDTADDGALAEVLKPGPDGLLGTGDDEHVALTGFTRQIEITDVSPTLRLIKVTIKYRVPAGSSTYVLTTYISSYA